MSLKKYVMWERTFSHPFSCCDLVTVTGPTFENSSEPGKRGKKNSKNTHSILYPTPWDPAWHYTSIYIYIKIGWYDIEILLVEDSILMHIDICLQGGWKHPSTRMWIWKIGALQSQTNFWIVNLGKIIQLFWGWKWKTCVVNYQLFINRSTNDFILRPPSRLLPRFGQSNWSLVPADPRKTENPNNWKFELQKHHQRLAVEPTPLKNMLKSTWESSSPIFLGVKIPKYLVTFF